jgi:hypothetical protein
MKPGPGAAGFNLNPDISPSGWLMSNISSMQRILRPDAGKITKKYNDDTFAGRYINTKEHLLHILVPYRRKEWIHRRLARQNLEFFHGCFCYVFAA